MKGTILGCLLVAAVSLAGSLASAQTCVGTYDVCASDSLSGRADRFYKDATKWTVIRSANAEVPGEDLNTLRADMRLWLVCVDGMPRGLPGGQPAAEGEAQAMQATPVQGPAVKTDTRRRINVLTGSDVAPFPDKSLPGGGLLAKVVQATMEAADPAQGFAIHRVDDWASHHEPLLSNALLDLGFPWFMPDCDSDPPSFRQDSDISGARLCRPKGYSTDIFDQRGRNWLVNGTVTLAQPTSPAECFRLSMEGSVDGEILNEFLGRLKIQDLDLEVQVRPADGQTIYVDGSHMVAHKSHPQGQAFLVVFEKGMTRIMANGTYQRIVDAHMASDWAEF